MHNQRLRQQPFNKPARLEQRLGFRHVGLEHPPHQAEGQDIENRAYRAKEDHEAPQFRGIPALRFLNLLVVDVIKRDRHLGYIVQQILDQQVQWQHRQERQKGARHQHAEDITKVRTGGHFDVFQHVGESTATFDHPLFQHHQAFFPAE